MKKPGTLIILMTIARIHFLKNIWFGVLGILEEITESISLHFTIFQELEFIKRIQLKKHLFKYLMF